MAALALQLRHLLGNETAPTVNPLACHELGLLLSLLACIVAIAVIAIYTAQLGIACLSYRDRRRKEQRLLGIV